MAIKQKNGKYQCSYCGKEYPNPTAADNCREKHDLIYVQMSREDLMGLLQFLATGESRLINPRLIRDLRRYANIKTKVEESAYLPDLRE